MKKLNIPGFSENPHHNEDVGKCPSLSLLPQEFTTAFKRTFWAAIKARVALLERELRDERQKRVEAESALKDVERECRMPFVVPALLESFLAISKLTRETKLTIAGT